MTRSERSARISLRQMCNLGLPASILLPSLLLAVRRVVEADHAAFFFCDPGGNINNLYAERMLPPDLMHRYHLKHFRDGHNPFPADFLRRAQAADPVSRRSVTDQERQGDYYKEVLQALDVEHFLYAVVKNHDIDRAPVGQLSLYRSSKSPAFSDCDARNIREVLHYISFALQGSSFGPPESRQDTVVEEAMAVLRPDGSILFSDPTWERLIRLARGERISPAAADREASAIIHFTQGLLQATQASPQTVHEINSPWGRFVTRHYPLNAPVGEATATALLIQRRSTDAVLLVEGAARTGLSIQQREVALMIAMGYTNKELADKLNVSVNTAAYHVKQVFAKLGVQSRADVATLLREA